MMEMAAQKRARQEQLNRVQAEIMAKAQANAALLASIVSMGSPPIDTSLCY